LSEPITKKEIETSEDDNFWVSSASMQGWRTNQEDAHNAILSYDDYSSLFAVYDGHGGHEVAIYTAKKLPNFIKSRKDYRMGKIEEGLADAFVEFDKTLTDREIVRELRVIAGKEADTGEEVDHEEVDGLYQDATTPIEAVMAQTGVTGENAEPKPEGNGTKAEPTASFKPSSALARFRDRAANGTDKPISPFLRAKSNPEEPESKTNSSDTAADSANNHTDAAAKLSFKEDETKVESDDKVINGSIEDKSQKKNGHSETKEAVTDTKKTNGHDKDEAYHSDSNGTNEPAPNAAEADIKGKGKGKGKGKSSQIVKTKSSSDLEEDQQEESVEKKPETEKPEEVTPSKKPKSAKELYEKLVSDDVMDEESEEDDENDQGKGLTIAQITKMANKILSKKVKTEQEQTFLKDAFKAAEADDDDDSDEGEEDMDSDATEEQGSTEDEDTPDEDEGDEEEYIGGDFNEDDDNLKTMYETLYKKSNNLEPGNDSGCTAVVALLVGRELYVANAGDSRCVVCRDGKAIEMSYDHKPEDEIERTRINKAGGRVTQDGRVNGGLNLSRAIGDHAYKTNKDLPLSDQMISPVPDVKKLTIDPEKDSFVLLACDGIWNSLSSQETVDFVNDRLEKKNAKHDTNYLTNIIKELFDHCLAPDTMGDGTGCDNMTAVIAKLKPNAFSNKKQAGAQSEASVTEKASSNLTEKKEVKLESSADSVKPDTEAAKRPAGSPQEPQAKKAKTDIAATEISQDSSKKAETKTEPKTAA